MTPPFVPPPFDARLRHELDAATAIIERLQWNTATSNHACPVCLSPRAQGHADGCEVGRYLASTQETP